MDYIEVAIKDALEGVPARATAEQWQGESPWTIAVKMVIVKIGRDFGWLTAANGCDSDEGKEWLYDVVWYQSDQAHHITDVPLVAESEWGGEDAIKEDFEKLLVARSRYRVMVFQSESEEGVRNLFNRIRLWISKFHRTESGDRYLLAGWAKSKWIFDLIIA
ncbi:hypothetical protein [Chitinilyticum aquatile]|uniref:hypothetical protein n=1 Tax=Chitinilyticum aquatile TaxID=362520 RepID=UPI0004903D21|nr:hypothetical protein [Chitinilyticum aquatile]